jgi:hypothetical protein
MVLPLCIFLGRCVGVKFSTFSRLHTFFSFLQYQGIIIIIIIILEFLSFK